MSDKVAARLSDDLLNAPTRTVSIQDLILAAQIIPHPKDDPYVINSIDDGPILVYRSAGRAVIARGYWALCKAYHVDPMGFVDVKIV